MCGRFSLHAHPAVIALQFGLSTEPELKPRYNIAPTTDVIIVRDTGEGRVHENYRWGLIPGWAKDPSIGNKLNNARGETVAEKPSFRSAFKRWRCLIPASGFYEWKTIEGKKQPYFIRPADDQLFGFAGLTERWEGPDGPTHSCCVITTEPNELMAKIHDRMPVIIPRGRYTEWLDPRNTDTRKLKTMIVSYPAEEMIAYPVTREVNNARNQGEKLIDRIDVV